MNYSSLPALTLSFFCTSLCVADAKTYVTGHDTVTTVGQPVALRAKFERGLGAYTRPDIKNAQVTFTQVGSDLTISARTDRDGVASTQIRAEAPGVYRFRASLDKKPGVSAESRVWVLDPAKPVVVIDIDGTLSSMHEIMVLVAAGRADTYPGAPALVHDLNRTHQIIYLTARDDAFDKPTRTFLTRHGYPDAPILFNDMGVSTKAERAQFNRHAHGPFKLAEVQGLQARGVNVVLGIGNAETDAYAYENAGVPSMIRTEETGTGPSFRFLDYANELRPQLEALGFLPKTSVSASAAPTSGRGFADVVKGTHR